MQINCFGENTNIAFWPTYLNLTTVNLLLAITIWPVVYTSFSSSLFFFLKNYPYFYLMFLLWLYLLTSPFFPLDFDYVVVWYFRSWDAWVDRKCMFMGASFVCVFFSFLLLLLSTSASLGLLVYLKWLSFDVLLVYLRLLLRWKFTVTEKKIILKSGLTVFFTFGWPPCSDFLHYNGSTEIMSLGGRWQLYRDSFNYKC